MKAAIDIGTNTVLLLVATVEEGRLNIIAEQQRVPRLGRGVDRDNKISDDAASRVIDVLVEYREILDTKFPAAESPVVTATSAVRDAANRKDFIARSARETGFNIKVLSGSDEAEYTFQGAQSVLPANKTGRIQTVLDIGGGSTEIAVGEGSRLIDRYSFDMGCVRFTERFMPGGLPSRGQIAACKNAVNKMLQEYSFEMPGDSTLIGVAGTVTSVAYMEQDLKTYDAAKIDGYRLSVSQLDDFIARVSKISPDKLRQQYPGVMEGRADIFLAGLLIMKGVMEYYHFNDLTVSTGGIRHGAILESV